MKVVRIFLVINDKQQIIPDLTEFDASLDLKFAHQFGFIHIVYLHLSLLLALKHITISINPQNALQITQTDRTLISASLIYTIIHFSLGLGTG